MTKNFTTTTTVSIDHLTISDLYSTRSTESILKSNEKAARNITRNELRKELMQVLTLGRGFDEPITTAIVEGRTVVLDGRLRAEVAQDYQNETEVVVELVANCMGAMTQTEAFKVAQTMNTQHGISMSAEQKRHVQLRQHILEDRPIGSVRQIAEEFAAGSTNTGAKIQKCLKWIAPYQSEIQAFMQQGNVKEAITCIASVIEDKLMLAADKQEALGIPTAGLWAKTIDRMESGAFDGEEDSGASQVQKVVVTLHELMRTNEPEVIREAMGKLDKKALGFTLKRTFDADAYYTKYAPEGIEF